MIISSFLERTNDISEFTEGFLSEQSLIKQAEKKSITDQSRNTLCDVLDHQYASLGIQNSLINKLRSPNTYTVCTGHQLNLLGGPKYIIHKIVSVIKLASLLGEKGISVVPVFWLASEDHDFDEINNFNFRGKRYKSNNEASGPVGRIDSSIFDDILPEIIEALTFGNHPEIASLFSNSYDQENLANAMIKWVHGIFKEKILILDGDNAKLKSLFIPVVKRELKEHLTFKNVNTQSEKLTSLGYHRQVNPREINLFYIENNLRERIIWDASASRYLINNTSISFSEVEMDKLLNEHPEKFSPNALMRPLYQETILPNLAYLGGPGEMAYWLQLKSTFESFNLTFPIIGLRDTIVWADKTDLDILIRMNINFSDLSKNEEDLAKTFIDSNKDPLVNLNEIRGNINELYAQLSDEIIKQKQDLKPMLEAEIKRVNKIFPRLERKMKRIQIRESKYQIDELKKIKSKYFKGNVSLERIETFVSDLDNISIEDYINNLEEHSSPYDQRITIIEK